MEPKERLLFHFRQFVSDHAGLAEAWSQQTLAKMEKAEATLEDCLQLWVSYSAVLSSSIKAGRQTAVRMALALGTDIRNTTFKRENLRGKKTNVTKTEVDNVLED